MSKPTEATRDAAGARYAAAVEELHAAFVNLSAYDWVLGHSLCNPPSGLWRPDYAPYPEVSFDAAGVQHGGIDWMTEIQVKRDALNAAAAAA
jgi:hypothetical protein